MVVPSSAGFASLPTPTTRRRRTAVACTQPPAAAFKAYSGSDKIPQVQVSYMFKVSLVAMDCLFLGEALCCRPRLRVDSASACMSRQHMHASCVFGAAFGHPPPCPPSTLRPGLRLPDPPSSSHPRRPPLRPCLHHGDRPAGLQPVLVHLSKNSAGGYSFHPVSINFMVEVTKTFFALMVLFVVVRTHSASMRHAHPPFAWCSENDACIHAYKSCMHTCIRVLHVHAMH